MERTKPREKWQHLFKSSSLSLWWRRQWQPTPVFLPGESHGQRSLVGYSPWGRKESGTTKRLTHTHTPWPKNRCFWTAVLEKIFESPLGYKKIQTVSPKGNWSWIFIGRTDAEAEAPILWPPDAKTWLIGKDPDAVKHCRYEKGTTEDEMVGWHHQLNGHEFEQALGDGEGQGNLECCSPKGHEESDTT